MNEEYFGYPVVRAFDAGFLLKLKLRLFGIKIVERAGQIEAVWYAYKGKLYFTKYSAWYLG